MGCDGGVQSGGLCCFMQLITAQASQYMLFAYIYGYISASHLQVAIASPPVITAALASFLAMRKAASSSSFAGWFPPL